MIPSESATTFLRKVASEMDGGFYILPARMKRPESLSEYVRRIMLEDSLSAHKVEARAKREARSRGVEDTHKLSDSTVNNILLEQAGSPGVNTLIALAWGLDRPISEVVNVAFGLAVPNLGFGESDFARMWETYKELPTEEKKFYSRQLEVIGRDMQLTKRAKKKSD